MAKNILQDVMTKGHRSIRHVPLPHKGRKEPEEEDEIRYEPDEKEMLESKPASSRRFFLVGAIILLVILLGFALSSIFTGATITVTPKVELITLRNEFIASKADDAKLHFDAIPINETAEMTIPADTMKKVSERASGSVVVYNAFSTAPQRLIKNTRFETHEGLIYRISSSITIPGKTIKDNREVPGSIETLIMADSPGIEYNIPLSDFTIPGFKTDKARFAGFYARSKTPITGGMDGMSKTPSQAALVSASATLQDTLEKKIMKEKQAVVPPGYILFTGALTKSYTSLPPESKDGGMSLVKEKVTGAAYIFRIDELNKAIANSAIATFNNLPIVIPDLEKLTFQLKEIPSSDPAGAKTIRFTLTGSARIVWLFDGIKLQNALLGKQKNQFALTLATFPTIEKADMVIRPFWSSGFPKNAKKVSIVVASPEDVLKKP